MLAREARCTCDCESCARDLHHACLYRSGCVLTAASLAVPDPANPAETALVCVDCDAGPGIECAATCGSKVSS